MRALSAEVKKMTRHISPNIEERLNGFQQEVERAVSFYFANGPYSHESPKVGGALSSIYGHNHSLNILRNEILENESLPDNTRRELSSIVGEQMYDNPDEVNRLNRQTRIYADKITCLASRSFNWNFQDRLSERTRTRNKDCAVRELRELSQQKIAAENIASLVDRAEEINETYMFWAGIPSRDHQTHGK